MRYLFIFLVFINICYLIWGVAFSEKKEPTSSEVQVGILNKLTLLSEKPDQVKMRNYGQFDKGDELDPLVNEKNNAKVTSRECFSIGPMHEEREADKLEEKLEKAGLTTSRKLVSGKEAKSFWVYIPPSNTMEDAKLMAEDLKHANVQDYFVIQTGKSAKAISLGLYNSYRRAKLRQISMAKIGFDAKVKTRYKDVTYYWIDIQKIGSGHFDDEFWIQDNTDIMVQKITLPCVDPLPGN